MQEIFRVNRKGNSYFETRGERLGTVFIGKQTSPPPNRLPVAFGGGGDCHIRARHNLKRDAHQHAGRRTLLVRAKARAVRSRQRGVGDSVHELRLSRAVATRQETLRLQPDNAVGCHAVRARGIGRATLDSNRSDKHSAVGVFKAHNDNLPCVGFGRAHGQAQLHSRLVADRALRRTAVHFGFKATGLGHVACLHGDILRHGDSVRYAVADSRPDNRRGYSVNAGAVAVPKRLSENANHGFP